MRIVGDIPHDHFKITIFEMNHRLSVKFENGEDEQTYKFREGQLENVEALKSIINKEYLSSVTQIFEQMTKTKMVSLKSSNSEPFDFPEII